MHYSHSYYKGQNFTIKLDIVVIKVIANIIIIRVIKVSPSNQKDSAKQVINVKLR